MCQAVQEYAERYASKQKLEIEIQKAVRTVKNMLNRGMSLETALECNELDRETYEKYAEHIQ